MHLLVAVINDPDRVVDVLDRFLQIGVKGATVIESTGMAHLIADHVPFFARFAELSGPDKMHNRTLFTLIQDEERLKDAVQIIEEEVGSLDRPDTGLVFAVPVSLWRGFGGPKGEQDS